MSPSSTKLPTRRIHPSLVRPILIAGIEREVAIPLVGIVLFLLLGFRLNFVTPALAAVLLFWVFPWLRSQARRDPQSFAVLKRHIRLAGFYRAQGAHDARPTSTPPTY